MKFYLYFIYDFKKNFSGWNMDYLLEKITGNAAWFVRNFLHLRTGFPGHHSTLSVEPSEPLR